jgi:uncharacterized membrane protein SirB2
MTPYEVAKFVHVTCAALSIGGFIARFQLALRSSALMRRPWIRVAPHVNDSVLLAAAIVMLVLARIDPLNVYWLQAKLGALFVYILFAILAMRQNCGHRTRICAFAAALLSFGFIVSVALTRSALGPITALTR